MLSKTPISKSGVIGLILIGLGIWSLILQTTGFALFKFIGEIVFGVLIYFVFIFMAVFAVPIVALSNLFS